MVGADKCVLCGSLTHAHGLVSSGLEAVVADAAVTALRVDALAVAAHVGDLLALVAVCGDGTTEKRSTPITSLVMTIMASLKDSKTDSQSLN